MLGGRCASCTHHGVDRIRGVLCQGVLSLLHQRLLPHQLLLLLLQGLRLRLGLRLLVLNRLCEVESLLAPHLLL